MLVVAYLKVIIQGFDWRFKKTRNIFFFNISLIKVRTFSQEFRNFKETCYLSVETRSVSICVFYFKIYKSNCIVRSFSYFTTLQTGSQESVPCFSRDLTLIWKLKVVLPTLLNFAFAISREHKRTYVQSRILSVGCINSSILLLRFSNNLTYYRKAF